MSRICPYCKQARRSDTTAPDWQCPDCGKAYDKADVPLPPAIMIQYPPAATRSRPSGKWLMVLLALATAFWFARSPTQDSPADKAAALAAGQPEVVLYATEWCGYCKQTREFFDANGIRYRERDVEKSAEAQAAHQQLGGRGVPTIVVGDDVVHGYDIGRLSHLLRYWLKT